MHEQNPSSRRRFLQAVLGLLGLATSIPLRRAFARTPTPAPKNGAHLVTVTVVDGANRTWFAQALVGDDPMIASKYLKLANANGVEHPGLTAWFYADCVEVGVTRIDCPYDYLNCRLSVTYDGADMPHAPSSKPDGTVDFWLGCRMPPIRYFPRKNARAAAWWAPLRWHWPWPSACRCCLTPNRNRRWPISPSICRPRTSRASR